MSRSLLFSLVLLSALMLAIPTPSQAQPAACECHSNVSSGEFTISGSLDLQASRPLSDCVTELDTRGTLSCSSRSSCAASGAPAVTSSADVSLTFVRSSTSCASPTAQPTMMVYGTARISNDVWFNGSAQPNPGVVECTVSGVVDSTGKLVCVIQGPATTTGSVRTMSMAAVTGDVSIDARTKKASVFGKCKELTGHVTLIK